jgi:hypothetical protein
MSLQHNNLCLLDGDNPPSKGCITNALETKAEKQQRFYDISRDLMEVVYDDNESAIYSYQGDLKKEASLFTILSIAYFESGFRKDVDLGIGETGKGDDGKSYCLMQIHVGDGKTAEGWTGDDLVKDRKKCFKVGYRFIKSSFGACSSLPLDQRLTMYASGNCGNGITESKSRINLAQYWFQRAPKIKDSIVSSNLDFGVKISSDPNKIVFGKKAFTDLKLD